MSKLIYRVVLVYDGNNNYPITSLIYSAFHINYLKKVLSFHRTSLNFSRNEVKIS